MKSLPRARRIRGLAIQKLRPNEQQEAAKRALEDHLPVEERKKMEYFIDAFDGIPGIGRAGALELLMKVSTFVAIVEMASDDDRT